MKYDNICERCKKPMDTTIAEMNAIRYGQNYYACEHCGMLYSIYRPEFVVYKPLGYWEEKLKMIGVRKLYLIRSIRRNFHYIFRQNIKL